MKFDTVIDPMSDEIHFIGLDRDGYWTLTWGKCAGDYSLAFENYIQVATWCRDFGIKHIINFDKIAAAHDILMALYGSEFVAGMYTKTIQQAEHVIGDWEMYHLFGWKYDNNMAMAWRV